VRRAPLSPPTSPLYTRTGLALRVPIGFITLPFGRGQVPSEAMRRLCSRGVVVYVSALLGCAGKDHGTSATSDADIFGSPVVCPLPVIVSSGDANEHVCTVARELVGCSFPGGAATDLFYDDGGFFLPDGDTFPLGDGAVLVDASCQSACADNEYAVLCPDSPPTNCRLLDVTPGPPGAYACCPCEK
jgi:hypothetical protein